MIRNLDLSFIRNLGAASLIIIILAFYPVYLHASHLQIVSFLYGYGVCMVNILIGFALNEIAMTKHIKIFMGILFGGMFIRIFLSAALLAMIIFTANADTTALIGSFFFFYVIFTAMELQFIHKKKNAVTH